MIRVPAVINYATRVNNPFSFLVKERLGVYHVYDYDVLAIKRELPTKKFKSKEELDLFMESLNILGLSVNRISDTEIQIVDPEYQEYEDVDLPLYSKTGQRSTYNYLNTSYVIKNVPTKETVKKAYEYKKTIAKKLKESITLADVEIGIGCSLDFVSTIFDTKDDVSKSLDEKDYLVFHIVKPYRTSRMYKSLVISKEKAMQMQKEGILRIVVPKDVAGIVIGKGGQNCKAMSEKLGLKGISVVAI